MNLKNLPPFLRFYLNFISIFYSDIFLHTTDQPMKYLIFVLTFMKQTQRIQRAPEGRIGNIKYFVVKYLVDYLYAYKVIKTNEAYCRFSDSSSSLNFWSSNILLLPRTFIRNSGDWSEEWLTVFYLY